MRGSVVGHPEGATRGGQRSPCGCHNLTRNRPLVIGQRRDAAQFAVFMAYFLASRAARMALWASHSRMDLVCATLAGLHDFAGGRTGARRP
jgi:hypothetical protein